MFSESLKERGGGCLIVEEVLEEEIAITIVVLGTRVEEVKTHKRIRGVSLKVIVKKIKFEKANWWENP